MIWFIVFLLIIILDQFSKYIINQRVNIGVIKSILPNVFYITHTENTGIALSLFENKGWIFMPLIIISEVVMAYYFIKYCELSLKLPLDLVLGGGAANLLDRLSKGSVTDFFQFRIRSFRSPIFNLADFFILIGAIILLWH